MHDHQLTFFNLWKCWLRVMISFWSGVRLWVREREREKSKRREGKMECVREEVIKITHHIFLIFSPSPPLQSLFPSTLHLSLSLFLPHFLLIKFLYSLINYNIFFWLTFFLNMKNLNWPTLFPSPSPHHLSLSLFIIFSSSLSPT